MDFKRIATFLREDIWRVRPSDLPKLHAAGLRLLRIMIASAREFEMDKCVLRASALTYYTLLAIVPMVAMAFGIAKGFGMQSLLEDRIRAAFTSPLEGDITASPLRGVEANDAEAMEEALEAVDAADGNGDAAEGQLAWQQEMAERIIEYSNSMLESVQGGVVAGIGVAILFFTIIRGIGNIERSFNEIWGVTKERTMLRKITDYLSFMVIGPILLVSSGSLTVFIAAQIETGLEKIPFLGFAGGLMFATLRLLPIVILVILFTFAYMFLPNGKVNLKSALIGGIVGGILAWATQVVYVQFQIGASRASAVYGSFAALPLFLVWVQTTWLIVLYGAELAFAHQNVETYEYQEDSEAASVEFRRLAALAVAHQAAAAMVEERDPPTSEELGRRLNLPIRFVNRVCKQLHEARILAAVQLSKEEKSTGWQPAIDLDKLTVEAVVRRLDKVGSKDLPLYETPAVDTLRAALSDFQERLDPEQGSMRLKDVPAGDVDADGRPAGSVKSGGEESGSEKSGSAA